MSESEALGSFAATVELLSGRKQDATLVGVTVADACKNPRFSSPHRQSSSRPLPTRKMGIVDDVNSFSRLANELDWWKVSATTTALPSLDLQRPSEC